MSKGKFYIHESTGTVMIKCLEVPSKSSRGGDKTLCYIPKGYSKESSETARKNAEFILDAVNNAAAVDFPECSGNPASCPENEGHGCCAAGRLL